MPLDAAAKIFILNPRVSTTDFTTFDRDRMERDNTLPVFSSCDEEGRKGSKTSGTRPHHAPPLIFTGIPAGLPPVCLCSYCPERRTSLAGTFFSLYPGPLYPFPEPQRYPVGGGFLRRYHFSGHPSAVPAHRRTERGERGTF